MADRAIRNADMLESVWPIGLPSLTAITDDFPYGWPSWPNR